MRASGSFVLGVGLAVLLTALETGRAWAHRLEVSCELRGDRVEVETFFEDGTQARQAKVQILDENEHRIAEGRTDKDGKWSFPRPAPGTYRVVVTAGAGHLARMELTVPARSKVSSDTALGRELPGGAELREARQRLDFGRFPWIGMLLGLGVITLAAFSLRWLLQFRTGTAAGEKKNARQLDDGEACQ